MMEWKIPVVLLLCLSVAVRADDEPEDVLQAKANAYIDEFIAQATNISGGFTDPLPLDEISKGFEREIGFVTVKGEAKLHDGKITGLSSLKRKGNAVSIDLDEILLISCELNFDKIAASYKGKIVLNEIGPKITVNAKIGKSSVSMFLMVPAEGGNASLISFNINSFDDVRVSIWGLGPLGWAASIISSMAINALEKPVAKAVSVFITGHFSKEIEKVPYPG